MIESTTRQESEIAIRDRSVSAEPIPKAVEPVLVLELDRPVVVPERKDQMRGTAETENTGVASVEFERTTGEIRALVTMLSEDVSNQRETLVWAWNR